MPRINLLPWRAELRQKRKKEFLVGLAWRGFGRRAARLRLETDGSGVDRAQQARNNVLRNEIAELDKQIEEIKGLESQQERLLARMQIIDQLQRSRPEVVHLFDELVNTMPEGVYLTGVKQTRYAARADGRRSIEHARLGLDAQHRRLRLVEGSGPRRRGNGRDWADAKRANSSCMRRKLQPTTRTQTRTRPKARRDEGHSNEHRRRLTLA